MRSIKLTLAYEGTAYHGWQLQPNCPTVQGMLERALREITGEKTRVAGASRTDAGVHALGQVVSFQTESRLPPDVLQKALNANLPADIAVLQLSEADENFHAIRDAVRKQYRYLIDNGVVRDLFRRRYAWHYRHQLDEAAMHRAAQALAGTHDFRSFETQGTPRESTVRTIFAIDVYRGIREPGQGRGPQRATAQPAASLDPVQQPGESGDHLVVLEVEGNGFLYNMVRTIVGSLVQVGRGMHEETWIPEVLKARDRRKAGMTAPPQGLFLVRVDYS